MRKKISFLLAVCLMLFLFGCGMGNSSSAEEEKKEITIAYQSSIGYAPLLIMKENQLIEQNYTGDVVVNWVEMKNGAEINEGIASGAIDIGGMGVPVAITGVMAGCPYKIAFGISAQPYSILSNSSMINSLSDITATDQIAITNINSQPHILLAMAAKNELGDAHALDNNLVVLSNPDGYAAIISKNVSCHMVISPYNFMEINNDECDIHEIQIDPSVWADDNTALVAVISQNLYEKDSDLYDAVMRAVEDSMLYIKENPEKTAEVLEQGYDADANEILTWMNDSRSVYSSELHGVMNMADFMADEGFLDKGPQNILEIAYENVQGE